MDEIHSNLLWIGNASNARDPKKLIDAGIRAVVDVAYEEQPAQLPRQIIYCRFPLNDGSGNCPSLLKQTLETTVGLLENKIPTLVACSAGMSRSPTVAAFALATFQASDPKEVIATISNFRSLELKPGLWDAFETVLLSAKDAGDDK